MIADKKLPDSHGLLEGYIIFQYLGNKTFYMQAQRAVMVLCNFKA